MSIKSMTLSLRSKIYGSDKVIEAMIAAELSEGQIEVFIKTLHSKKTPKSIIGEPKRGGRKVWPGTREKIYDRDGRRCVFCGSVCDITIDHIIPVSKGGLSRSGNLQTLCLPCNIKKGNK